MQSQSRPAYVIQMEFNVLGPLEVVDGGQRRPLGGPKQRSVLALLIADAGRPVSMGSLIDGTYGEHAPDRAHRSIHTFVSNLRRELGDVIERDGDGYSLTAERSSVDAMRFEDLVAEASAQQDPSRSGDLLRAALGLWRGHAFADIDGQTVLEAEITRLSELRIAAIEARVTADLESGRHRELIAELESLTTDYPLHERFRAQQMLALYRSGRQGDALRAYERTRLYLVDELGLDPSQELRDLEQRILDQDTELIVDLRPDVKHVSVLVADVADPGDLAQVPPDERHQLLSSQSAAFDHGVTEHAGRVFGQRGSAIYAAFDNAVAAVHAAADVQRATAHLQLRLRMAIADGDAEILGIDGIAGPPVSRAAALVSVAHGGQVLLAADAQEAATAAGAPGLVIQSLGSHDVTGIAEAEPIYQLIIGGDSEFPPLRIGELPPSLPITDRRLPGYEIRDEVGSGAFGIVHRAYQPSVGREVAIKIIRPEYANSVDFIRRFEVEAQLVARLEHPHIVPMHDYWREPDGAYLVMRSLGGGSLAERLRTAPVSLVEADDLVRAIGSALDYAHRHGVAHRDLKPSNVLFDDDGNAYLTDFGVAMPATGGGDAIARDVRDLARLIDSCLADKDQVDAVLALGTADPGFTSVRSLLDAWAGAIGAEPGTMAFTETRNPYKGLRAFGELDADDFFGRDEEVERLVTAVAGRQLVAVVGPSGIGKSSVVRAGLIPALRSGSLPGSPDWLVTDMMPGPYPFEELASSLLRVASQTTNQLEEELRRDSRGLSRAVKRYLPDGATLLLVIDQFEELFTLVEGEAERAAFLEMLLATSADPRSNVRIVVTIRADFFDRPLRFGEFGELLRDATLPIAAPAESALRMMIAGPADGVGVAIDPGLVERLVADVEDQPGALPLLEFSLTELFDRRRTDMLTLADYEATGGVLGALGRRAEVIFDALDSAGRDAARQIFLRLVNVAESGRDTRRRVRRVDLERLGIDRQVLASVLDRFGEHRLLAFDRDPTTRGQTVEVAHEAILTEWSRLSGWIDAIREDLLLHGRLAAAMTDWEAADRGAEFLLSGGRLAQHEAWTGGSELPLTSAERSFLKSSRQAEDGRLDARRRARGRVLAGLGAATLVAVVLAGIAIDQRNDSQRASEAATVDRDNAELASAAADEARLAAEQASEAAALQQNIAEQATATATARELAVLSTNQLGDDPEQSLLLALEAVDAARAAGGDLLEVTTALRLAIAAHRVEGRFDGGVFAAVSPDGTLVATAGPDDGLLVRNLATGEVLDGFDASGAMALAAGFSPDSDRIGVVYASVVTPISIWDIAGRERIQLGGPIPIGQNDSLPMVSFDERGESVAAFDGADVSVWTMPGGVPKFSVPVTGEPIFIPGTDELLVTDTVNSRILIVDAVTGTERRSFDVPIAPWTPAVSPDGKLVVIASQVDLAAAAYDIATGTEAWRATIDRAFGVEWLTDGERVAVGSDGGRITILAGDTGDVVAHLGGGHAGAVWALAAVPGQHELVTSGFSDGTTLLWNTDRGPRVEIARLDLGVSAPRFVAFAPFPDQVFVSERSDPATARIIDAQSLATVLDVIDPVVGGGIETRIVGDGSLLATITTGGASTLRDTRTGDVLYTAPPGEAVRQASYDAKYALVSSLPFPDSQPVVPHIVEIATGRTVTTVDRPEASLPWFSYDGRWIIDGSDGEIRLYDTATGESPLGFPGAMMVRPMPDGTTISLVDGNGVLWHADLDALLQGQTLEEAALWNAFVTEGFLTPFGHVVSGDGSLIATKSRRLEPVNIWDVATGERAAELDPQLINGAPYIFFHPDDPYVTLLSEGGILLTYTLDVDELIDIAHSRRTRWLTDAECFTYLHVEQCPADLASSQRG